MRWHRRAGWGRRGTILGLLVIALVLGWTSIGPGEPPEAAAGRAPTATIMPTTGTTGMAGTPGTPPGSGRVFVVGDSLTSTATWDDGPGAGAPADVEVSAWLGWTASDGQAHLDAAMAAAPPATVVVALGTNDSVPPPGGDGWTQADVLRFRLLMATPPPGACLVLVLPGHGAGIDPAHAGEMDRAAASLRELARRRRHTAGYGPTVVVDWQALVDARPGLLGGDGIHLASDPVTGHVRPDAAARRTAAYWRGVRSCGDP